MIIFLRATLVVSLSLLILDVRAQTNTDAILDVYADDVRAQTNTDAILDVYADIAEATYSDALAQARRLNAAIDAMVDKPSPKTLQAARQAWIAARPSYQQGEVYRFGNPIVDDWEGRVNAWPLDEGLIDYTVQSNSLSDNPLARLNVIANKQLTIDGKKIDATVITPALLRNVLHESAGNEANVATGYHAIEFLLWGQDLSDTGPGNRPASDFDPLNCTHGHCQRRIDYLRAASQLLIADLDEIHISWGDSGAARQGLYPPLGGGIKAIIIGMGSLSYGELAGERMKLGLMLHDQEEEHDCFSDNTHDSHYFDQIGIINVYTGHYQRHDGTLINGASLSNLIATKNPQLDQRLRQALEDSRVALSAIRQRANTVEAYDQMLKPSNSQGHALIMAAIDALIAQSQILEETFHALGLNKTAFDSSDSLDHPDAIFQ